MAGSGNCTNIGIQWTNANVGSAQPWTTTDNTYSTSGASYIGYSTSGPKIYTTLMRITTPTFSSGNISDVLTLNLCVVNGTSSAIGLNWAICSSDSNKNSYFTTSSSVSDSTKISGGTITIPSRTSSQVNDGDIISFNLDVKNKLSSNTTYYLYLWPSSTTQGWAEIWTKKTYSGDTTSITLSYFKSFTITYYANGGTGAPKTQTEVEGTDVYISSTKPTRESVSESSNFTITGNKNGGKANVTITATKTVKTTYTFKGWGTSSSATSVAYKSGDKYNSTESIKLYAIWSSSSTTTYENNTIGDLSNPSRNNSVTTFTVSFDTLGGTSCSDKTATKTIVYKFGGWASTKTSTTKLDAATSYTSDTTVYAIWNVSSNTTTSISLPVTTKEQSVDAEYIVSFDSNGGASCNNITCRKLTTHTFKGWSTSSTGTSTISDPYTPTKDIILYAVWTKTTSTESAILPTITKDTYTTQYTVTLDYRDGTPNTTLTSTKTIEFEFLGWSTDKYESSYVDNVYTPTKSITLYAIWKGDSNTSSVSLPIQTKSDDVEYYTVTLDNNDGSGITKNLQSSKTTKYTFKGWVTSEDDTTYLNMTYTPTADITLFAVWDIDISNDSVSLPDIDRSDDIETIIVTLDAQGGNVNDNTLEATKTTMYGFLGWSTTSSGGEFVDEIYTPTGNITLYARWVTHPSKTTSVSLPTPTRANDELAKYTVTLDTCDGNDPTYLIASKYTSYTFLGWGTTQSTDEYVSSTYKPSDDIVLYAIWQHNDLSIDSVSLPTNVNRDNDIEIYTVTLNNGIENIDSLKSTKTTEYSFKGWTETINGTSYESSPYTPSNDITLYAAWDENSSTTSVDLTTPTRDTDTEVYKVTLDPKDGTVSPTYLTSDKTTTYKFIGWSDDIDSTNYVSSPYTPTKSILLYAIWELSSDISTVHLPNANKDSTTEKYIVTLDPNGGTVDPTTFNSNRVTSYDFLGWVIDEDSTDIVPSSYKPSGNVTLYAVWSTVVHDADMVNLPDAKNPGYSFMGWRTESGVFVSSKYIPTESITLYASWDLGGLVHIGNLYGVVYIYHNNNWRQVIPEVFNNGSFKICS